MTSTLAAGPQAAPPTVAKVASATSDVNGNITFTFDMTPIGWVWTGTISVPTAPATANWVAQLAGVTLAPFSGANIGGSFQCPGGQQLQLVGTGLIPSTKYTATWNVKQQTAQQAAAEPPSPYAASTVDVQGFRGMEPVVVTGFNEKIDSASLSFTSSVQTRTITTTAEGFHETVCVTVSGAGGSLFTCAIKVKNLTAGINSNWHTHHFDQGAIDSLDGGSMFFPVPVADGDQIAIEYLAIIGGPLTVTMVTHLMSLPVQPYPLRPDGRPYPIGWAKTFQAVAVISTGNLIVAPGAGLRIMLKKVIMYAGSGAGSIYTEVKATINGTTSDILAGGPGAANASPGWPPDPCGENGLLCDANTAVTFSVGSAAGTIGAQFTCIYDITP